MDFLDTLELDTKEKKSHRVRSWYLYEQFKSLENHQLNAARKLKNKYHQDRILRQELSERRARRTLYEQVGLCTSESLLQERIKSDVGIDTTLSMSNEEFFESFSESEDGDKTPEPEFDDSSQDFEATKYNTDDFKSAKEQEDNNSCPSVNSVIENYAMNDDCVYDEDPYDEYTKEEKLTTITMAQDINKQLEAVKENIQCLENIANIEDIETSSAVYEGLPESASINNNIVRHKKKEDYNNVVAIWSRVVSFAYQLVQLNHGNCFCDYSSQFLTAVLAFDVLRRGVNLMCNILQPYVSPIVYCNDMSEMSEYRYKNVTAKRYEKSKKFRKIYEKKVFENRRNKCTIHARRNYSENCSYRRSSSFENGRKHNFGRASEPWRGMAKNMSKSTSSSSIWPRVSKNSSSKLSQREVYQAEDPMLKVTRYIDGILKDLDEL